MKNACFLFFFLLIQSICLAQKLKKDFIVKTHPAAWAYKNGNLGVEIGINPYQRITLAGFKTTHFPGHWMEDLLRGGDLPTFSNGYTTRLGFKSFSKKVPKNNTRSYTEGQFRFGKIHAITEESVNGYIKIEDDMKNIQLCYLLGIQREKPSNSFIIDLYIGIGLYKMNRNPIITDSDDVTLIGTSHDDNVTKKIGVLLYFGTSIGFNATK